MTILIALAMAFLSATCEGPPQQGGQAGESKIGAQAKPRDVIKSMVGSWEGTCRTWFTPDKLADESKVLGKITAALGETLYRHEYKSTMRGKPREGEELIAYSSFGKRFQVSWIDDFHVKTGILFSEGDATPNGFTVKGKYDTGPSTPQWGWKTVYELTDSDHLTITAYNITPQGQEAKAVETKYVRTKK